MNDEEKRKKRNAIQRKYRAKKKKGTVIAIRLNAIELELIEAVRKGSGLTPGRFVKKLFMDNLLSKKVIVKMRIKQAQDLINTLSKELEEE
jgi:P2-related tail formation protein